MPPILPPDPSAPTPLSTSALTGSDAAAPTVWPVSFLVSSVRLMIERQLGLVWVAGEVSGFTRAASGHCYFVLKDDKAQVRCTLWKQKALALGVARTGLRDGARIEVRAVPTLYEGRGEFQLNVDSLRLAGQGALYERFLQLKAALEAEGLFDADKKRPLPRFPRGVALVTSPHGAALHDMLTTLARRWPALPVVLYPTAVQGEGSARAIATAIATANARAHDDGTDVLIVARGGGSLEDLWAFNEEAVVRAVAASALPVVSGVGHETDITLCDFVADLRAPTPTAAATAVAPDGSAWHRHLQDSSRHLQRSRDHQLNQMAQRLDRAAQRLVHPRARLATQHDQLATLRARLTQAWHRQSTPPGQRWQFLQQRWARLLRTPLPHGAALAPLQAALQRAGQTQLATAQQRIVSLQERLTLLDPQQVLARGYAIVSDSKGQPVLDATLLHTGDAVRLTLAQGEAKARIEEVLEKN